MINLIKNNLKNFKYIWLCVYKYNNNAIYSCAIPYNSKFDPVSKQRLISENLVLHEKIYTVEEFFRILEYTLNKNLLTLRHPSKIFQETTSCEECLLFPVYRFKHNYCKQDKTIEDKVLQIITKNNNILSYYNPTKHNLYAFELFQIPSFLEKEKYFEKQKIEEINKNQYKCIATN